MSAPLEPLLKTKVAAKALGISERTFWSWVSSGRVRVVRLSARCVRVRPEDIRAVVEAGLSEPSRARRRAGEEGRA